MAKLFIEGGKKSDLPLIDISRADLSSYGLWLPTGFGIRSPLGSGRNVDFEKCIQRAEEVVVPPGHDIVINHYPQGINYIAADPSVREVLRIWVEANRRRRSVQFIGTEGSRLYVDGEKLPVGQVYRLGKDERRPVRYIQNGLAVSATVLGLDLSAGNQNLNNLWGFLQQQNRSVSRTQPANTRH